MYFVFVSSSSMLVALCFSCFLFFFQAEDGIRDYKVTGVQTCALPICGASGCPSSHLQHDLPDMPARFHPGVRGGGGGERKDAVHHRAQFAALDQRPGVIEIGRASCRERENDRVHRMTSE